MSNIHSFRFRDDRLNRELIDLLKRAEISSFPSTRTKVSSTLFGAALRRSGQEAPATVGSIRGKVFRSWQVLTCPSDWITRYRDYMSSRDIPFVEELSAGELWFLIPRAYRPHSWKLDGPIKKKRLPAESKG